MILLRIGEKFNTTLMFNLFEALELIHPMIFNSKYKAESDLTF